MDIKNKYSNKDYFSSFLERYQGYNKKNDSELNDISIKISKYIFDEKKYENISLIVKNYMKYHELMDYLEYEKQINYLVKQNIDEKMKNIINKITPKIIDEINEKFKNNKCIKNILDEINRSDLFDYVHEIKYILIHKHDKININKKIMNKFECCVCLEENEYGILLYCDHMLCKLCIDKIVSNLTVKCPLCRRYSNIDVNNLTPLSEENYNQLMKSFEKLNFNNINKNINFEYILYKLMLKHNIISISQFDFYTSEKSSFFIEKQERLWNKISDI